MTAIFDKIDFSSLENFRNKKSFENFFDAPVSACACAKVRDQCFWPSSARLCLVKFHRARLSALPRVSSCSCAMLRRIGKSWIPSVKFHRIVRVYLRSVKFFHALSQ